MNDWNRAETSGDPSVLHQTDFWDTYARRQAFLKQKQNKRRCAHLRVRAGSEKIVPGVIPNDNNSRQNPSGQLSGTSAESCSKPAMCWVGMGCNLSYKQSHAPHPGYMFLITKRHPHADPGAFLRIRLESTMPLFERRGHLSFAC